MRILSIETSCDETSIAVLQTERDGGFSILSNIVSSQVKIHAPYGGVVPMLAKREHQRNLVPLLKQALSEAALLKFNFRKSSKLNFRRKILSREPELLKRLLPFLKKYQKPDINLIAVTNGPGLEPALWVGVNFAKALGYYWNLPIIPVNHIEGHIAANWLAKEKSLPARHAALVVAGGPTSLCKREELPSFSKRGWRRFDTSRQSLFASCFPAIVLVVSGGHTQLILMRDFGKYKILGETRDDAAGEAFDKLAKMLSLGYPGGPIVAKLAQAAAVGQRQVIVNLPRPMLNSSDYDFSFSGLKTAALYFVKKLNKKSLKKLTPDICAEFQQAVIDVLVSKTIRAAKEFKARAVLLSGGVASNDLLRETLRSETDKLKTSPTPPLPLLERGRGGGYVNFRVPPKEFCTDNAAMIALTAYLKTKNKRPKTENYDWQKIKVDANLRLA